MGGGLCIKNRRQYFPVQTEQTRLNGNFYEYQLLIMDDTKRTRLEG